jgi:hypothetical protein
MPAELRTTRGIYRVSRVSADEVTASERLLTLAIERADGIERVTFQCRIARDICPSFPEDLTVRLGPWIERHFEEIREAELKSIRAERKLYALVFDRDHRGPFAADPPV